MSASSPSIVPSVSSGGTGTGTGTGAHIEPSEELRLQLLQLLVKLVECEQRRAATAAAAGATNNPATSLQNVFSNLDKLVSIVLKTVNDPFADLKKESCVLISLLASLLATAHPSAIGLSAVARTEAGNALQKCLLPNLKHQHSQVRVQSLQAFGALVRSAGGGGGGSDSSSDSSSLSTATLEALPLLSSLAFDRTPRVREVLIEEVVGWIVALPSLLPTYQAKLVLLLLHLSADEVPQIATKAVEAINTLGDAVHKAQEANTRMTDVAAAAVSRSDDASSTFITGVDAESVKAATAITADPAAASAVDAAPWPAAPLSSPFPSRPPASSRALFRSHASELLPAVLSELSDWTQVKRVRAGGSLKTLLLLLQDSVATSLVSLLQALIKSIRDESPQVHVLVSECAELVGFFLPDASVWIEWMLLELEKNSDTNYRNSLLLVLLNLIKGMPVLMQAGAAAAATAASGSGASARSSNASVQSKIAMVFPQLLNTLSHPDLCCSSDASIRLQLHRIITCMLSRMPSQCGGQRDFAQRIFHMLVQLDTKLGTGASAAAAAGAASSSSAPVTSGLASEEERQILTALELLARCEVQYGDLKVEQAASSAPATTAAASSSTAAPAAASSINAASVALLQSVYAAHFLPELRLLLGDEIVQNPSSAASLLPEGWGQNKDPQTQFVCLTFFQLLERAVALSTLGASPSSSSSSSSSTAASALLEVHLPLLLPVLVHSARPSNDASARSLALAFVYKLALLHQGALLRGLDPELLGSIVVQVLMPNCVWRAGRVASSLRLHALTVLHALLSHHLIPAGLLLVLSPGLLPVLKSNLDDDEARMRMLVLLLLQLLVSSVPAHSLKLEDEVLTELHRDLLKRLDDAHDDIRLQVVRALSLLLARVFPPASDYDKTDSYFRYIVQCFCVYLDDANPAVVEACFAFLREAIPYNRKVFIQEVEAARSKQTTGQYCEQLLALAKQQEQQQ
jgi:dynein assembly factor 5